MPTYEYECTHCGYIFEAFQNINAKPLKKCPKCHSNIKKLISFGGGIIFKGSGFYATDYHKKTGERLKSEAKISCPKAKEGCDGCSH